MTTLRQSVIGLSLAGAVVSIWLSLHVGLVFFYPVARASILGVGPLILLQTWIGSGMFIVAHDAMHGSLSPRFPRLNALVGGVALGLYAFFPYGPVMANHHDHHRRPGLAGDPDFHAGNPKRFWPWYAKFFRAYFGPAQAFAIATVVTIYITLLHASLANVLLFWAAPALLSSVQLFTFGTWLPHRHNDAGFRDRHNARTLEYSWPVSLLACYHFGYHLEHHLSPATPWWGLPRVRAVRRLQDA